MGLHRFGPEHLGLVRSAWDDAVDATDGADEFCASSRWAFAAAESFPHADPPVIVGDGTAFCGMRRTDVRTDDAAGVGADAGTVPILVGLDPIWGFATPVVGHPVRGAECLAARMSLDADVGIAVVAGQHHDAPLIRLLPRVLPDWDLFRGPTESRLRIDLTDGTDAWFARRSPRFRQRLRRIEADAVQAGVDVVDVSALDPDTAVDRILDVESRSWKASEETGLNAPDLADFYRRMAVDLAARDHLRLLVARIDDRDVGYILGGIRGSTYRGLQLSYDHAHRDLGLGHLLQLAQLRRLVDEGVATYDLGMEMDYKRRWADRADDTFSLVLRPRR